MKTDNEQTMEQADQLRLAKSAIMHVLSAIRDDPRKYWLMGAYTASWDKLTTAAAALWDEPMESVLNRFLPDPVDYEAYQRQKEYEGRLLRYCREHDIKPESE